MRQTGRFAAVAVLGGLALVSAGCDEETAPPLTIETPAPVRGVIATTSYAPFIGDSWIAIPISVGGRGKLDITVDWTYDDTWMYVYFGNTACDYPQLAGGQCPFLIESESKDPKPRVFLTGFVDPGTYYVVMYNVPRNPRKGIGSDNTEAVSLQVGLTVGFIEASEGGEPVKLGQPLSIRPPGL